jgi:16S rRNA (guanine(966)-N(2))-methyltransferase RsmD
VRVIAGSLGGRRLVAPRGLKVRPTSDRVRESLFMTLEPFAGRRVLDLFAGTGALGIESLSRGAERVDFVESDPMARRVIETNLSALGLGDRATIWGHRLPQGLNRLEAVVRAAELVFMDPPYGGELADETLRVLGSMDLEPDARVLVEHHAKDRLPDQVSGLERERQRRYGETAVSWYRRVNQEVGS